MRSWRVRRKGKKEKKFHGEITDECTPFALGEVVARAAAHGLRYLGEALPEHW